MMDSIIEPFVEQIRKVTLKPPQIPFVSNVTGTWITAAEATNPSYWARHLRETVRFSQGIAELVQQPERILLEVGPGRTLSTFAQRHQVRTYAPVPLTPQSWGELDFTPSKVSEQVVLTSMRHPNEKHSDVAFLLNTLGRLWLTGVAVDWSGFYAHEPRHRIPLPTYPFERQRYWISPQTKAENASHRKTKKQIFPTGFIFRPGNVLFCPYKGNLLHQKSRKNRAGWFFSMPSDWVGKLPNNSN
jgi:acyl transferase domain-containing protein